MKQLKNLRNVMNPAIHNEEIDGYYLKNVMTIASHAKEMEMKLIITV